MPNLTPFVFEDALVRVKSDENGNPWFVAKDVCNILDLDSSNISRQGYLDDDEKGLYSIQTLGGFQDMLIVSESGLYSLVFRSRKPEANRFRKWVTGVVLPSLRKTGFYAMPQNASLPENSLRFELEELPDEVKRLPPRMRERCLGLALQAGRLVQLPSLCDVHNLFLDYCRIVAGERANYQHNCSAREFIQTCLQPMPGSQLSFKTIWHSCLAWCKSENMPRPTVRTLSNELGQLYQKRKISHMVYLDLAFV